VQKKKIWESVQPELRTSAEGVACWKEVQMLTSAGAVTVTRLLNGHIS
jgi:aminoacyl tRNA synthase complex-interacting multifunctional protein 1